MVTIPTTMRRRAWRVFTLTSFIFAVLIGAVWVRSYVQYDVIVRHEQNEAYYEEYVLGWSHGRVSGVFKHRQADPQDTPARVSSAEPRWDWLVDDPVILRTGRSTWNGYGFTALATTEHVPANEDERGATWTKCGFVLPCWAIFGVSLVLPAIAWRRGTRAKPQVLPDPSIG